MDLVLGTANFGSLYSFNQRRISQKLNVSATGVSKAIKLLEKKELILIKKDEFSKELSIELNFENQEVLELKRIDNLSLLYETKFVEYFKQNHVGCDVILFGSYSRGEDTLNSDIDIAIIGTTKKELTITMHEEILKREINLFYFENMKKIPPKLRKNIMRGIYL